MKKLYALLFGLLCSGAVFGMQQSGNQKKTYQGIFGAKEACCDEVELEMITTELNNMVKTIHYDESGRLTPNSEKNFSSYAKDYITLTNQSEWEAYLTGWESALAQRIADDKKKN